MKRLHMLLPFSLAFLLVACQEQEPEATPPEEETEQQEKQESDVSAEESEAVESAESNDLVEAVEAMNLPDPPSSPEEVIEQPEGITGGVISDNKDADVLEKVIERMEEIPSLPEEASKEELDAYYKYLYSLLAFDFPDPKGVIDQMQFQLSGSPDADPKYQFKENYNIEIILDASGSMGAAAGNGTRMDQAKKEINEFLSTTPEEANVSLRVYGHEGTGDEADKAMSCAAIEEVYEREAYNESAFQDALNQFEPAGWTPVAGALESSMESFADLDGEQNTNLVYLVSDGIETCDGDPVAAAKAFANSHVSPIINVIGFNADAETQMQLKEVAESAEGIFTNVNNSDELAAEFDQTEEILARWKEWKRTAEHDVLKESLNSRGEILNFAGTFFDHRVMQEASLSRTLDEMEERDMITWDQKNDFKLRSYDKSSLIVTAQEKYEEEMNEFRDLGLAEMEQKIEELYPDEAE
ncbi:hypothetical protein KP77_01610 [Jeotgalibacillus alimentarius]|uniref:VWFA domain-containing protein n=1 Tax=Jeotgalibacillus alimentarius TaxID=135826 RepID=A0A0C2WAR8_9BACL|nr:VWA domain-containing protein [Jeotgalibacillus alimentarius]KIL53666.1 hypothetical protein KP77_01610 [Jeotgalibacillus alimentarius]